jgi:hypothetical protein
MLFFDFEVFKYYWVVVIIDMNTQTTHVIDNRDTLLRFYEQHKNDIWCGYNSKGYDQYILKAILLGYEPYKMNDWIINQNQLGWKFAKDLNKIQLNNYDCIVKRAGNYVGLKNLEYHMGESIIECSVPFDLDRPLTAAEKEEVITYCTNDVEATIRTFLIEKKSFDAKLGLVKMYNLPLNFLDKTNAQLTAKVLGAERVHGRADEFDIVLPDTLRLTKYKHIADWYLNPANQDYDSSLSCNVWGLNHDYGWGGFHACRLKYQVEGCIVDSDITSLYPSLMIEYNLLSRNIPEQLKHLYAEIKANRVKLKKEKNPLQEALKLILNTAFGILKDVNNDMYDPLMSNLVCLYGQLLMTDLIEKLEIRFGNRIELLQSNTDGIFVKLESWDMFEDYQEECEKWSQRTRLGIEHQKYTRYIAKDVNNYMALGTDGKVHRKGGYIKELSENDYELAIVNKALVDYFTKDVALEDTIRKCNRLKEFQMAAKLTSNYDHLTHGSERLPHKYYRVFASKNPSDSGLFKVKRNSNRREKIANTPTKCFIDNSDINGKRVPRNLDKNYYIELSYERLKQFTGRDPRQISLW